MGRGLREGRLVEDMGVSICYGVLKTAVERTRGFNHTAGDVGKRSSTKKSDFKNRRKLLKANMSKQET